MEKVNRFIDNRVLFNRMFLYAAFVLLCLVTACSQSGSNGTDGTTPVSFTLQFPGSTGSSKPVHRAVIPDPNKIASLSLSVINSIGTTVATTTVPVTSGQPVTINLDVPTESGLIFKATVFDTEGNALYRGESSPTTIIAGVETSVTITLKTLNPLAGSWFLGPIDASDIAVVTFLDDTHYMIAEDGLPDDSGQPGMESGTYTWDISTGLFIANVITETNRQWGFSHPRGAFKFSVSGNTLTLGDDLDTNTLTRVVSGSNPLIGSWFLGAVGTTNSAVITFLDDSHYMIAFEVAGEQPAGIERGTYNWDASTGIFFVISVEEDTNGSSGFSHLEETFTISVSGNILTISTSKVPLILRSVPLQETISLKFEAETVPGVYDTVWSDTPGFTVFTFNSGGTGVVDWADDPTDESFTWSVDAQGRLIVDLANDAPGTLPDRYTLVSGTINAGTISAEVDDNEDGVYEVFPTVNFTKQG